MNSRAETGIFETLPMITPDDETQRHDEEQYEIVTGIVGAVIDPSIEQARIRHRTSLVDQDTGEQHD